MGDGLTQRFFPFESLGLARNPFSSLTEDEWAALAWLHPAVREALDQSTPVVQILGESGRGKSSTLLAVKRELLTLGRDPHYVYLPPDSRRLKASEIYGDPLLIDEIERLPARSRRRLYHTRLHAHRDLPSLIFSSHVDLVLEVERLETGTTASVKIPSLSETQLGDLLNVRIRSASTGENLPVWFNPGAVNLLSQLYGGDLRRIERTLYEVFQRLESAGEIDRGALRILLELSGGIPEQE
jgi:hypothetical protein